MKSSVMKIVIISENTISMNQMCRLIGGIKGVCLLKAYDVRKAYQYASKNDISLFIMDFKSNAEMEKYVSAIRFMEQIRAMETYRFTPLIVTATSRGWKQHLYAYLHCYRYFEKPYDEREFRRNVKEALGYQKIGEKREYLYYKKDRVLYSIRTSDIVYIQNKGAETLIYHSDAEMLTAHYKSCKARLMELRAGEFLQCNRSTIINTSYIERIDKSKKAIVLVKDYGVVRIGSTMKKRFLEELADWKERTAV